MHPCVRHFIEQKSWLERACLPHVSDALVLLCWHACQDLGLQHIYRMQSHAICHVASPVYLDQATLLRVIVKDGPASIWSNWFGMHKILSSVCCKRWCWD